MATFNLSAAAINAVVETLKADAAVLKKWLKTADDLRAEGVTSEILSTDKEYRAAFKEKVILLSFSKVDQAIMAKPHASLSDEEKVTKRWVQNQIGSRLSRVTGYVKRSEVEEQMSDEERGARRVSDLATRLGRDLAKWIDKIELLKLTRPPPRTSKVDVL